MLELEVLISELLAVDTLAACAVAVREVTTLTHELLDYTVEGRALVAKAFLSGSQSAEVLSGLQQCQPTSALLYEKNALPLVQFRRIDPS